ncbi:MAG: EAL domain-containing protein [Gammaproteobacteria bacterium]|nr:EAL domain-containing protein [Gammaproteobacteria bacterium]
MLKFLFLFTCILLPTSHLFAAILEDKPGQLIRVGVFSNPPVAFEHDDGGWRGISIDVLQSIADKKGWQLQFVSGSFAEHLQKFERNQIDLIALMAYSGSRAKKYTYNKIPLISNWGLVYKRPGSDITSLLDLENRRVGVMRNNIHDRAFRKLVDAFSLNVEIVELPNFSDVMESVVSGSTDAGVSNRLFGAINADKYGLLETGVIFNPINIHYASLEPENKNILKVIDQHLDAFKKDKDSIYYSALHRWTNQSVTDYFPGWLIWLSASLLGVLLLVIAVAVLLKKQVAIRTHELQLEIDERREAERQLDNLAYYDALTQLPNRVFLLETLKVAMSRARRRQSKLAVLFIDIDRFKTVNDSLGHDAGDQLIIQVAKRLQSCLRGEDTIHRFGGDEFVAVLQDIDDLKYIDHVTNRMLAGLNTPINIGMTEVFSSVCIGVSLFPNDDDQGDNLLKYADAAMYHAKDKGGNNYQFYNKDLTLRLEQRLSLETRLRHALERNEFLLYYQPIFDLNSLQPVGVEALIRWQDPERGLIQPDEFIPLAEETGMIVSIGEWVLENACAQIKEWELQGLGKLKLAVNISSLHFDQNKLYSSVISIIKHTGINADQLELEITERMFLNITTKVRETLDKLTNEGVRLSIDDFGTGYSSLSYLKQLPIDTLKIDRSFIAGIPDDNEDIQITSTIILMAHGLGMAVVAEGIETKEQLNFLQTMHCGRGQGYFLSKPVPKEEILKLLK